MALTKNGDLYVIGQSSYGEFGLGDQESTDVPVKTASNVKEVGYGSATYYIDNNNDLYKTGFNFNGGYTKTFEKVASNVSFVTSGLGFCDIIIDNNNDLYVKNGKFSNGYCGLTSDYDEFTKIASNAKYAFVGGIYKYHGYISYDNELFMYRDEQTGYVKRLDNVISIVGGLYITSNNEIYEYDYFEDAFTKIEVDNFEEVYYAGGSFYKGTDGNYYYFEDYDGHGTQINSEYYLNADDIKEIIYIVNRQKYVYLGTDNKIHLYGPNTQKTLENSVDSLAEILMFVK